MEEIEWRIVCFRLHPGSLLKQRVLKTVLISSRQVYGFPLEKAGCLVESVWLLALEDPLDCYVKARWAHQPLLAFQERTQNGPKDGRRLAHLRKWLGDTSIAHVLFHSSEWGWSLGFHIFSLFTSRKVCDSNLDTEEEGTLTQIQGW